MKKAFIVSAISGLLVCSSWATTPNMEDWRKAYTRYRFAVDAPRSDNSSMQLSEIELLDGNRERISSGYTNDWDSVTKGSYGNKFPSGQTPDKAVDGDTGSKWLDWRAGLSNSDETRSAAWLEFRFDEPTKIYGYRWYTADDWDPRDPVAWTLSAFDDDDGTWHVLDKVAGYNTPSARKALAYEYLLDYEWVDETAETSNCTGAWTRNVAYGADGKADILGYNAFTPYSASTGNVVTVEVKTVLKGVELDIAGNQESDVQAAVCLSTNGNFHVWAGNNPHWVEVAADGVTPVSGEEYTLRFTVNYLSNMYSVEVKTGLTGFTRLVEKVNPDNPGNPVKTSFPLACASDRVSEVSISGATRLTSLIGNSVVVEGFVADEKVFVDNNVSLLLSAAQAAWLNGCSGSKDDVSKALAYVPSAEIFNEAYLLNFDISEGEFDYSFKITGIEVLEDSVKVEVTLKRFGETNGPINGTLKFYGAETLSAFKSGTATPIVSKALVDDDFSDGDTTTATFDKEGNVFFDAKIEER